MKISIWPNQAVREFHTRTRITEDYLSSSLSLDNNDELVSIFFNLPGVIQVSMRHYSITITKAEAFDWPEVEEVVINEMAKLGWAQDVSKTYIFFGKKVEECEIEQTLEEHERRQEKFNDTY